MEIPSGRMKALPGEMMPREGWERSWDKSSPVTGDHESSARHSHPSPSARWGGAQLEPLHSPGDRVTADCRGSVS